MDSVNIILNGKKVAVQANSTILNAAKQHGIDLPTLCYHPDQRVKANCRVIGKD
mgnify:FL=1